MHFVAAELGRPADRGDVQLILLCCVMKVIHYPIITIFASPMPGTDLLNLDHSDIMQLGVIHSLGREVKGECRFLPG